MGRRNSMWGLEAEIEGGFVWCGSCGISTPRRSNGGFSSLTCEICSMSITVHPCCGWCAVIGPVMRGLHLTTNATGPHW